MRALALVLAAALAAAAAEAQPAPSEPPAVPSGPAAIRGRVVEAASGEPVPGVPVVLYALDPAGAPGLRRTTADASGRFAFEWISKDPELTYLVGARYAGVPYGGGRLRFGEDETLREVAVRVAEVTRDPGAVVLEEARLRVQWRGAALRVVETLRVANRGERTFFVPPEARAEARPAARTRLPEAAGDFRTPFGVVPEGVEREGSALAWWGPIYPRSVASGEDGLQDLVFSYELPAEEGRAPLDAAFPDGVPSVRLLVPEGGPELEGPGLTERGSESVEGRPHRVYEATPAAGGRLEVALALPEARVDPDAVSVAEARLVLDLDDAAIEVRETHVIRVDGESAVRAPQGGALLRIPLPESARGLRFDAGTAGLRLAPHPEGGLSVEGTAPAGESELEIAYRLPVREEPARIARRFAERVPLLSIYVTDDGHLAPDSERLHRRRPVRTQDRTYMHLEAFEVEAGERVALALRRLPPREGMPRAAVAAVVLAAAGGIAWLLAAPLRPRGGEGARGEAEESEPEGAAARERGALYAALRDLDEDRDTGKVSEEDHARLREELRARALALLREERARASAERERRGAEAEADAGPECPACGARPRSGDRFCAQCGRALAAGEGREARG